MPGRGLPRSIEERIRKIVRDEVEETGDLTGMTSTMVREYIDLRINTMLHARFLQILSEETSDFVKEMIRYQSWLNSEGN